MASCLAEAVAVWPGGYILSGCTRSRSDCFQRGKAMNVLFHLDGYMFSLIEGSGFVLIVVLGILKILAKHTTWSADDEIIGMLLGVVRSFKKGNGNGNTPVKN